MNLSLLILDDEPAQAVNRVAEAIGAVCEFEDDPRRILTRGTEFPLHDEWTWIDPEGEKVQCLVTLHGDADSVESWVSSLQPHQFDLILVDNHWGGRVSAGIGDFGLEQLLPLARSRGILVALFTARGPGTDGSYIRRALSLGADAFVAKGEPVSLANLLVGTLRRRRLAGEPELRKQRRASLERDFSHDALSSLVGQSSALLDAIASLRHLVDSPLPILILGETGTGKEVLARAIHQASSRRDKPFVAVNISALAEGLVESELFGHEKGAFSGALDRRIGRFEAADGGTLFLDEIGELSKPLQVKLLRVLNERVIERVGSNTPVPVDIRLVSATNADLPGMVASDRFRGDFYARLKAVQVRLPPLRERKEDIPELARHFVAQVAKERGVPAPDISNIAMEALRGYGWPYNVRELRDTVVAAFYRAQRGRIEREYLVFNSPQEVETSGEMGQQLDQGSSSPSPDQLSHGYLDLLKLEQVYEQLVDCQIPLTWSNVKRAVADTKVDLGVRANSMSVFLDAKDRRGVLERNMQRFPKCWIAFQAMRPKQ